MTIIDISATNYLRHVLSETADESAVLDLDMVVILGPRPHRTVRELLVDIGHEVNAAEMTIGAGEVRAAVVDAEGRLKTTQPSVFAQLVGLADKHGTVIPMEDGTGDVRLVRDILCALPLAARGMGGGPSTGDTTGKTLRATSSAAGPGEVPLQVRRVSPDDPRWLHGAVVVSGWQGKTAAQIEAALLQFKEPPALEIDDDHCVAASSEG